MNYRSIILHVIWVLLMSCDQETAVEPFSRVSFVNDQFELSSDELRNIDVKVQINPPALENSEINVSIEGAMENTVYSTTPPTENGIVSIPVMTGDSLVSFSFNPIFEGIGVDDIMVEFEINAVGKGLLANELEGRFAELLIISEKGFDRTVPYVEDFNSCLSGVFPPKGWKEMVIQQNEEGSSRWGCIIDPAPGISINAFIPGSEDTSSSEVWMLSPRIDLNNTLTPTLQFDIDRRFTPADPNLVPYDLLVSTDYNGQNFENASWNRFESGYAAIYANDPDRDGFSQSGSLDLSAFANNQIVFAFVYRAGSPGSINATILRISNISVLD